jgi:hypothetical protein
MPWNRTYSEQLTPGERSGRLGELLVRFHVCNVCGTHLKKGYAALTHTLNAMASQPATWGSHPKIEVQSG